MTSNDKLREEVKKIISSLIISISNGITVRKLRHDYKDVVGEDIPFKKLGFSTLEQFLLSIPETCRINGAGDHAVIIPVITEKNQHINKMVLKQKQSKTRYPRPKRHSGVRNTEEPSRINSAHFNQPPSNKIPPANFSSYKNSLSPNVGPLEISDSFKNNSTSTSVTPDLLKGQEGHRPTFSGSVGPPADYLDSDEESLDDYKFDNDEFCYVSDEEDLRMSMRKLQLTGSPIKMLREEGEEINQECRINQEHQSRVSQGIKDKLRVLISEHPDGIWCSEIPELFYDKFLQRLNPLEFGFQSVIQLCDDLPDVFQCTRPNRTDWKIYDCRKPIPKQNTIKEFSMYLQSLAPSDVVAVNTEPPLPPDFVDSTPDFLYPEDVLQPDETIRKQWLLHNEERNDYIEILVSEVYDPSKFWIQLKGVETSVALTRLMDDMQLYYVNNARMLQLNEFSVRIGLFCAAPFMGDYHRAVVIKVFDDETIKVFYVDYGTIAEVPLKSTCFLHKDFSALPQQAIRGRLANIIPKEPNTMWPRVASLLMLDLIRDKDLVACIRDIDYDRGILNLIITDTNDLEVDIHINDVLIEEGHAILGFEAPKCASSTALIPNVHLYPTFEEIETGVYPNIGDVVRMLKLGHNYETIFPGYFDRSCSFHSPKRTCPRSKLGKFIDGCRSEGNHVQTPLLKSVLQSSTMKSFKIGRKIEQSLRTEKAAAALQEQKRKSHQGEEKCSSQEEKTHMPEVRGVEREFQEEKMGVSKGKEVEDWRTDVNEPKTLNEFYSRQEYEFRRQRQTGLDKMQKSGILKEKRPQKREEQFREKKINIREDKQIEDVNEETKFCSDEQKHKKIGLDQKESSQLQESDTAKEKWRQEREKQLQERMSVREDNECRTKENEQKCQKENRFYPGEQNEFTRKRQIGLEQNESFQIQKSGAENEKSPDLDMQKPNQKKKRPNVITQEEKPCEERKTNIVQRRKIAQGSKSAPESQGFTIESNQGSKTAAEKSGEEVNAGIKIQTPVQGFAPAQFAVSTNQNRIWGNGGYFPGYSALNWAQPLALPQRINSYNYYLLQALEQQKSVAQIRLLAALYPGNVQRNLPQTHGEIQPRETANVKIENNFSADDNSAATKSECKANRFVWELDINGRKIHVLNIGEKLYVVSQEIVTNLLDYKSTLTTWLQWKSLNVHTFPNKLINLMKYKETYEELKCYSIPGVYPATNLGCNIRVTSLKEVVNIVNKYGNPENFPDLASSIEKVIEQVEVYNFYKRIVF